MSFNLGFVVGNGENVLFWQDEWIEGVILAQVIPLDIFPRSEQRRQNSLIWELGR